MNAMDCLPVVVKGDMLCWRWQTIKLHTWCTWWVMRRYHVLAISVPNLQVALGGPPLLRWHHWCVYLYYNIYGWDSACCSRKGTQMIEAEAKWLNWGICQHLSWHGDNDTQCLASTCSAVTVQCCMEELRRFSLKPSLLPRKVLAATKAVCILPKNSIQKEWTLAGASTSWPLGVVALSSCVRS